MPASASRTVVFVGIAVAIFLVLGLIGGMYVWKRHLFFAEVPPKSINPQFLEHMARAWELYAQVDRESQAQTEMSTALKADPDAEAELRDAIGSGNESPDIHFYLANILQGSKKFDDAIEEYRRGLRLKPEDAVGHFELSVALSNKGDKEAELAELREAVRLKPDFARAHGWLSEILKENGQPEAAASEMRKAVDLAPGSAYSHYLLGQDFQEKEQLQQAVNEYRLAAQIEPGEGGYHLFLLGRWMRKGICRARWLKPAGFSGSSQMIPAGTTFSPTYWLRKATCRRV